MLFPFYVISISIAMKNVHKARYSPSCTFSRSCAIFSTMKRIHFVSLSACIFIVLSFSSCYTGYYEPYLVLDVEDEYAAGTVIIGYSFMSEKKEQLCQVGLFMAGSDDIVFSEDMCLPQRGTLVFDFLDPGAYNLYFAVLSEKGRNPAVIPFLEQNNSFLVR